MFRSLMTRTVVVVLAFAGVLSIAGDASAAYQIRITVVGSPGTLDDNDIFGTTTTGILAANVKDTVATVDSIGMKNLVGNAFVYMYANGTLTFNTVTTNAIPLTNNALNWLYDVSFVGTTPSTASGSITIEYSRTGYLVPSGLDLLSSSDSVTNTANSPGTTQVTQGISNGTTNTTLYLMTTTLIAPAHVGPNSTSPISFSDNLSTLVNNGSPYTLTSVVTLSFDKSGELFGNGSITLANFVPVPAGLVLALTGLPALGLFSRLRRRNIVQA